MSYSQPEAPLDSCAGCALGGSRRQFLREAAALALGSIAALGARPAAALPVDWLAALAQRGSTVSYPIPAQDGVSIDREHEVILVRWEMMVYAFALSCPHQRNALRWLAEDTRFQCPKHKSKYRPDGSFISGRATRAMDRYSIARDGENVVVDLAALHKQDTDTAGWNSAALKID